MNIVEVLESFGKRFSIPAIDSNAVIQEVNVPKSAKILDVGTGMGIMAITLALNGYNVLTGEPSDDDSIYAKQDWLENAKRAKVDHLIKYKSFDAKNIPFDDGSFDAIFSLGTFHHIKEADRPKVIKEFIRATKQKSIICFLEPNQKTIDMIRETDEFHPDTADPSKYIQGLNLISKRINGIHFDAFVYEKP